MFNGSDLTKVPCFKDSFFNGILSGLLVGIGYNLGTSRNPFRLAFATYTTVLFGTFFKCRYDYRLQQAELKKIRAAMGVVPYKEGTQG